MYISNIYIGYWEENYFYLQDNYLAKSPNAKHYSLIIHLDKHIYLNLY